MLIIITGVLAYILGGFSWQNRFWRASRKERKAWCEEQSSLSPPPQEARSRSTGERVKRFRCKHCRCAGLFAWLLLLFLTPWPLWPSPSSPEDHRWCGARKTATRSSITHYILQSNSNPVPCKQLIQPEMGHSLQILTHKQQPNSTIFFK